MIRIERPRRGFLGIGVLVKLAILLLVIGLLVLDTPQRKALLLRSGRCVLRGISIGCEYGQRFLEKHFSEPAKDEPRDRAVAAEQEPDRPAPRKKAKPALPEDFQAALQLEVMRINVPELTARWGRVLSTAEHAEQVRLAVDLAIDLPPRVWRVNGALTDEHELNKILKLEGTNHE